MDPVQLAGLVGTEDGTFLVRNRLKKGGGIVEDEFVLTVVFKVNRIGNSLTVSRA